MLMILLIGKWGEGYMPMMLYMMSAKTFRTRSDFPLAI